MESFKSYLRRFVHLPNDVWEEISSLFKVVNLNKGAYFYKEGDICSNIAYVLKGILRSFYVINGEEITRFVSLQDSIITAFSSYVTQLPSEENIQAITDCKLYMIDYRDMNYLYEKYPIWEKLGRLMLEQNHLRMEKRMVSLLALSAEQRYKALCKEQPAIIRHVPLQYIASILGVKPETLSRIRKKIAHPTPQWLLD